MVTSTSMQAVKETRATEGPPLERLGILLLGDSIDYRLARSCCNLLLGQGLDPFGDDAIAIHHNLTGASLSILPSALCQFLMPAVSCREDSDADAPVAHG